MRLQGSNKVRERISSCEARCASDIAHCAARIAAARENWGRSEPPPAPPRHVPLFSRPFNTNHASKRDPKCFAAPCVFSLATADPFHFLPLPEFAPLSLRRLTTAPGPDRLVRGLCRAFRDLFGRPKETWRAPAPAQSWGERAALVGVGRAYWRWACSWQVRLSPSPPWQPRNKDEMQLHAISRAQERHRRSPGQQGTPNQTHEVVWQDEGGGGQRQESPRRSLLERRRKRGARVLLSLRSIGIEACPVRTRASTRTNVAAAGGALLSPSRARVCSEAGCRRLSSEQQPL